jgi:YadA-like membrane anchor domain
MRASKFYGSAVVLGVAALVQWDQALAQSVPFASAAGTAPAGTLSGPTLASNVTNSSLTSVGTLTGLDVAGPTTLTGTTSINTAASTSTTTLGGALNQTFLSSASNTIGDSSTYATVNNLGTGAAFQSSNVVGNSNVGSTVNAIGGAGSLSVDNLQSTLSTGTNGGMVQTDAVSATVRASHTGTLASNGSTGTMAVGNGGGYTAYATTQSTGAMNSIGAVVDNKSYTNKISGNTFVDGNVYINGTLDYVSSNSANTTVINTGAGASILAPASTAVAGGTAIVMKGATGTQTVVDAHGKLSNVTGAAAQATASLTLTNGLGNTHGVVVTETQATLSGGTQSSSLTMADNGATFSDAATGAPVQVHGVNDGSADFDAVNVRQFAGAIASVTAMANIPQVDPGSRYAFGVGVGGFMGRAALAAGLSYRFTRNGVFKASLSSAMSHSDTDTFGLGMAWSF